jgi:formate C-acetyltransferase
LVRDCIEKARGYHNRGARYNVLAPHAGGLPDAADSLLVVKKLVFERKVLTLAELVKILRDDWRDREDLRKRIKLEFEFYGNDNAEADAMARRILGDFVAAAAAAPHDPDVLMPPGLSTFGREIEWRTQRKACAAGGKSSDILSTNCSPSPGADKKGPTAVIRSHCSLGLERLPNGTALELKIHPSSVGGENGLRSLMGLMCGFMEMGGIFLQIDVVDSELLREAQRCPEKYPNLAVRISGWSARFATLNRQWQNMIIQRTEQR